MLCVRSHDIFVYGVVPLLCLLILFIATVELLLCNKLPTVNLKIPLVWVNMIVLCHPHNAVMLGYYTTTVGTQL